MGLLLLLFLGLWFNVKTVELNQKIHQLRRDLIQIKKENAYLEEFVIRETRFSEIEDKTASMNLIRPKKIQYIDGYSKKMDSNDPDPNSDSANESQIMRAQ